MKSNSNKSSHIFLVSLAIAAVMLLNSTHLVAGNTNASEKVTTYRGWSIPQYVKPDPNLATLRHYFLKDYELVNDSSLGHYRVEPAGNSETLETRTEKNEYLSQQMNQSGLLSYILYDGGRIKYDEISPKNRLGDLYTNKTQYLSNSVGKSFVSYLVGHAICEG